MRSITVADLLDRLDRDQVTYLLDVRTPEEFDAWHIRGAVNLPLQDLPHHLNRIPRTAEVFTICAAGARSASAAQLLEQRFFDATSVDGGMAAWANVYDHAEVRVGRATIIQVRRRGKGCFSFVIGTGGQCMVVDPSTDLERYEHLAASKGWTITAVLDTHLHADHLSGGRALASAVGAHYYLGDAEPVHFSHEAMPERITLGDAPYEATIEPLRSPGHTMGSTMFLVEGAALLTGDTLFLDGVGRPDLAEQAEEFANNLYESIHRHTDALADDVLVLPAHISEAIEVERGVVTGVPLGQLRWRLVPLTMERAAFVAWASSQAKDRPPNYQRIVEANQGAVLAPLEELIALEVGPNRCAVTSA